jgi:hypothetical protein
MTQDDQIPPKSDADLEAEQAGMANDEPTESLDMDILQFTQEVDQASNEPQEPMGVDVRRAIEEPKVASVAEAVDQANDEQSKQLDAEAVDRTSDLSTEELGTSAYAVTHQLDFTAPAPPHSLHPAEVDGGGILSQAEPRGTEEFEQTSDVPKEPIDADAPQDVKFHEYRIGQPLDSSEGISSSGDRPDASEVSQLIHKIVGLFRTFGCAGHACTGVGGCACFYWRRGCVKRDPT